MLWLPRIAPKVLFARRYPHRSLIHVHTPLVNISGWISCAIQIIYSSSKQFLWYKIRVYNTINQSNHLRFTILCVQRVQTTNVGNQPLYFHQMIPKYVFIPQEGLSRSQSVSSFTTTAWIGKITPKPTQNNALSALAGDLIAVTLVINHSILLKIS